MEPGLLWICSQKNKRFGNRVGKHSGPEPAAREISSNSRRPPDQKSHNVINKQTKIKGIMVEGRGQKNEILPSQYDYPKKKKYDQCNPKW